MSTIKKKRVSGSGSTELANQAALMGYGKLPPQARELEEAVLGALMVEKGAQDQIADMLVPEVFYVDAHQEIYRAMRALLSKQEPVDMITVTEELRKMEKLEAVGGAYYISSLTHRVASGAHIEFHSRILIQKFLLRELIRISSETLREAFDDSTDVFSLFEKVEQGLYEMSQSNFKKNYENLADIMTKALTNIEKAKKAFEENEGAGFLGLPSGFLELDRLTGGFQESDLIILAARPGVGKTAFLLNMARNMAIQHKAGVAFFSLEMSSVQLANRLIAIQTEIPGEKISRGHLAPHEWEQLVRQISVLEGAPIYIDDTPALSIFELRAKCRRLKAQKNIRIAMVDYLQLMQGNTDQRNSNREQEISYISRSLKALAKELNMPIIALSQLSRRAESRQTQKPILSDLRESGAIEQDADLVMFIYRPDKAGQLYDENNNPTQGMAEIILAKHRNGPVGEVQLRFVEKLAKFEDLDHSDYLELGDHHSDQTRSTITRPSRMNQDEF